MKNESFMPILDIIFFTDPIVTIWNSLQANTVLAESMNCFKEILELIRKKEQYRPGLMGLLSAGVRV